MDKTVELKCPDCGQEDPNEFGICRARKTGRNLYCKGCIRKRVYTGRDRVQEIRQAQKWAQRPAPQERAERKPSIASGPDPRSPVSRVQQAISEGYNTRDAIKKRARLTEDQVSNALAILMFDAKSVAVSRAGEYPVFILQQQAA